MSSGLFFDASLDPFADDDGFMAGKGRKRTKFARHSDSWRLLDKTPSPKEGNAILHLDNLEGSAETAASAKRPQTVSNAQDVEILDERPVERAQLESTPPFGTTASTETNPPSNLPETSLKEVGPDTLVAIQDLDASSHEARQMQPPERPLRKPKVLSGVTTDSVTENANQLPARLDLETPRLGPLPSPGLPLVSPLIRPFDEFIGHLPGPSSERSELDASGDHPQSVTTSEKRSASDPPPAVPPELEQLPLPSPIESEFLLVPQSEVTVSDPRLEVSLPVPEGLSALDQSFQPVSWPSSYEEGRRPRPDPFENSQPSIHGKGSEFEFLDTSPVEAHSSAEHIWPHVGGSADAMVTLPAPSMSGVLTSADVSVSPLEFHDAFTQKISHYDEQTLSTPQAVARSDTAVRDVGGAAPDENVNAQLERAPDSSSQVLVDPSLAKSLEADVQLVTKSEGYAEVTREAPEQVHDSRSWSEKLDVSAVDAESQQVYSPPPFPFQQHWHRRTSGQRSRRSSNYASLDGASDEGSADELSDVEDMSQSPHRLETFDREQQKHNSVGTDKDVRASTPALSPPLDDSNQPQSAQVYGKDEAISTLHALDGLRSVVVLDISDEDDISGGNQAQTVEEAVLSTALSPKEQIPDLKASEIDDLGEETGKRIGESQELATDHVESPAIPQDSAPSDPSSPAVHAADEMEEDQDEDEPLPLRRQDLVTESSRHLTEPTALSQLPDEIHNQKLSYQLVTPENTQHERGDAQPLDETAELGREISLPPTPLNTQEDADVPQPTVEIPMEPAAKIASSEPPATPMPTSVDELRERRRSPRLSRKFPPSQGTAEVVSPYFTPRRTSQRGPQDQLTMPDKITVIAEDQAPVDGASQATEKEHKLTDISLTQEEVAPKSQLTTEAKAGLTTPLSYYTLLSLLQDHFSQSVDVLALSTTASAEPHKSKSGPRDWHTTLHLTEPSLHGNKTITAQIFRPYKTALPKVQRGQVVLLRSFKVQSQKRKCSLLSTESSAWAVFDVPQESGHKVSHSGAVVVGPPVEYGLEETSYAAELKEWWESEGAGQHPVQIRGGQTAETMPAAEDGDGELTHVLRDGTVYQDNTEGDEELSAPRALRSGKRYVDPEPAQQQAEVVEDQSLVHELRDGTVYQDNAEGDEEAGVLRELRSGKRYADPEPAQKQADKPQQQDEVVEDQSLVHELRDGTVYQDNPQGDEQVGTSKELRSGRRYADPEPAQEQADEVQQQEEEVEDESLVHELRDGLTYTDD